jgi:hypothetical protein
MFLATLRKAMLVENVNINNYIRKRKIILFITIIICCFTKFNILFLQQHFYFNSIMAENATKNVTTKPVEVCELDNCNYYPVSKKQ